MKNSYFRKLIILFFCFFLQLKFTDSFAQTFATIPFYEGFENSWINKNSTRDVPSIYWNNIPANGPESWSRDDDGASRGAWYSLSEFYLPSGAMGTNHSARHHNTYEKKTGQLDLYVDFSSGGSSKYLSFWYISPKDHEFGVKLSTNGGVDFDDPVYFSTSNEYITSWKRVIIDLSSNNSTTTVIRFYAISISSSKDFGLDEIRIDELAADFSADTTSRDSVLTVQFFDQSKGNPTAWHWDFNNDGIVDDVLQNPVKTFISPEFYSVKLQVSNGIVSDYTLKENFIQINQRASLPFFEDFEDDWINRNGTRDIPGVYWNNSHNIGFNEWSRDDDGYLRGVWSDFPTNSYTFYTPSGDNNSKHSARASSYIYNTNPEGSELVLSADFSTLPGEKYLSFSYINSRGTDSLCVLLSKDGGMTYSDTLAMLHTSLQWSRKIFNLGDLNATKGAIRFASFQDFTTTWKDDIGIDEVKINDFVADFTADKLVGDVPLDVTFTDITQGNHSQRQWIFEDEYLNDTAHITSHTYTRVGEYKVKMIVPGPGYLDSIVKINYIKATGYANLPFYENFDNTWVDRNDLRDVPSLYWKNTPATGINSWSRDDDGVFRGAWENESSSSSSPGAQLTPHGAKFESGSTRQSGTLDLFIDLSTDNTTKYLSFWLATDNSVPIKISISTDGGNNFGNPLPVNDQITWYYTNESTINLGNLVSPKTVIRFEVQGDSMNNVYLDEVNVYSDYVNSFAMQTDQEESLILYPNPSDGILTIQLPPSLVNEPVTFEIIDIRGKTVALQSYAGLKNCSLNIAGLNAGIYYIRTIFKDKVYINKVTKK